MNKYSVSKVANINSDDILAESEKYDFAIVCLSKESRSLESRKFLEKSSPDCKKIAYLSSIKKLDSSVEEEYIKSNFKFVILLKNAYSGLTNLAKPDCKVFHIETGIGDKELDAEGRVLITEFDRFILVNTYAPHSHRELLRVEEKRRFCMQFLILIKKLRLRKKPLIVVGDLNVAHKEIDLTNYKTNKNNAGLLEMERQWMTDLLSHGLCDAFRLFHEDIHHCVS